MLFTATAKTRTLDERRHRCQYRLRLNPWRGYVRALSRHVMLLNDYEDTLAVITSPRLFSLLFSSHLLGPLLLARAEAGATQLDGRRANSRFRDAATKIESTNP
ncbi:hypothetical protein FALBO_7600 [Fusarium albosuccineum]|uniref:Uncharacterized protein n=1 Tax=Fusarium albosuccineum TaxID=1237068 RepID=A0A8H4LDI6_9HYPO|nr:hypothetical protein FALBO_7600 [Fusarium albosuccineum]